LKTSASESFERHLTDGTGRCIQITQNKILKEELNTLVMEPEGIGETN
jgi:hypothetical protein